MHITNELIHNPGVNDLLKGMDIEFMEKDGRPSRGAGQAETGWLTNGHYV